MKKCTIDCGHGGHDAGATVGNYREKDFNLAVGIKVRDLLKNTEVKVHMTRDTDKYIALQDRCTMSNNNKSDIFVSIHWNSYNNTKVAGFETFASTSSRTDLASNIHRQIIKDKLYTNDRGVKTNTYHVLKNTNARACIVECGFCTNPNDLSLMINNIDKFALSIANGILNHFKLPNITTNTSKDKLYRVIVSSCNKSNADKLQKELVSKGYKDTYLMEVK